MPDREAAKLVETLARAMQLAHSCNVVHRDLKPANILLTADGTPKITDFGLTRQIGSDSGATQAGAILGTPSYMAPEQASGLAHEAGPAADIYALGAILYDCLAGRPPSKGTTIVETLDQVRTQEPVPPSRLRKSVPLDLERICLKCLRKEPEKRYSSAAELADDLVRYQQSEPILARPVGRLERAVKWVRRNPAPAAAALAVVLALTAGATVSYLKYREAVAARLAEFERGKERDEALRLEVERARERDAALDDARRQLSHSSFLLAVAAYDSRDSRDFPLVRHRLASTEAKYHGWEWHYFRRQATGGIYTLCGHRSAVGSVAFSPDGTRIVTGSQDRTARVWDARISPPHLELKGHTSQVSSVAFTPDGTRIVTSSEDKTEKVWDARTGAELKGEPIPQTIANNWISPDGRFFAHPEGNRVELIPMRPDEAELAYRLLLAQPNSERYREGYEEARANKDDFAAGFYLKLLPPPEQKNLKEAKALIGFDAAPPEKK